MMLSGGSAFGLGAANGVVDWLREKGHGFPTPVGPVPLVTAAVCFDLPMGEFAWPEPENAYAACEKIKSAGGKVVRPPGPMKHGTTVIAFVEDPDSYKIELIERPA